MRPLSVFALLVVLAVGWPIAARGQEAAALSGNVLSVSDGNTFVMMSGGKKYLVRILGVEAPLQSMRGESRDNLSRLIKGKAVRVTARLVKGGAGLADYYIGKALLGSQDIGLEQIRDGFAWESEEFAAYQDPEDRRAYEAAAEAARAAKSGAWGAAYKRCEAKADTNSAPSPMSGGMRPPHRVSGVVLLEVVVDESGRVESAKATCGHPVLQTAAVKDVRRHSFAPARLSGQPVKVSGVITYNFVLDEAGGKKGSTQ